MENLGGLYVKGGLSIEVVVETGSSVVLLV